MTNNGLLLPYTEIVNTLMMEHKWASGYWTEEDVLVSIRNIMKLVGSRNVFKNTFAFVKIEDGRGSLPTDVVAIDTLAFIRGKDTIEDIINCDCDALQFVPMRWMTDVVHRKFHTNDLDYKMLSNLTYTVNDSYIFANFEEGIVCVFYQQLPKDENGMLMIPNHVSYIKAISYDVALKAAREMFMSDKLTADKYQLIDKDRDWYVSQAGNSTKIMSPDERAALKNKKLSWPGDYFSEKNFHLNLYKKLSLSV